MNIVVGLLNVALGCVYTSYGIMTAIDLKRGWRTSGFSHFGAAWLVMAFTCGPHHLEHGLHQLWSGRPGAGLELVALVVGAPAGVTWFLLRIEALKGGRGDRPLEGTPTWLRLAPTSFVVYVVGLLAAVALLLVADGGTFGPRLTPNVLLVGLYTMVGYYLLKTQLRRHRNEGGWSLSGVSLTAVFPTCALMHLTWLAYAVTGTYDLEWHLRVIDWLSVPAAIYFLWVVRALSQNALTDWNKTAVAGAGVELPTIPEPRSQMSGALTT
jgi:hypothetical protein